ncbi:camp-dependent protein kinase regulatory subunit [Coniochaeta ligniaria NRRL 30616]|uniref:cAMP-dependent protein kinase regulatory subunit n=1 Tax=Coniochaeta ligniaria NRRL 30616 TaxID=1408157 RepID=A0A1J7IWK6_9PEZI|nr:camp-dependent protein kinase regulatory subunit [Coniochaeta ligniaria NRRL 30616]
MSSPSFTSPFGANSNPFGGSRLDAGGMQKVIEEEGDIVTSPTTPNFGMKSGTPFKGTFGGPFGGDGAIDGPPSALRSPPNPESYPAQYNFNRRTSVSAESLKPAADTDDSWTPPFHPKSPDQLERLKKAIEGNFLFSHLDEEQNSLILGALQEKLIPAKDIKVITQGDTGDYFYVVEKGKFDVYVNSTGSLQPGPDGMGVKVTTIDAGGSFGELALMYNSPRAATVISAEPNCTLWAVDRTTFRRILMESTFARRRMYEGFLSEVPLLSSLTAWERSKIADALETQKFPSGSVIIREGEPGSSFFLLEEGEVEAYKSGSETPVMHYKKGDFFGELALLNDAPRAASVVAKTDVKVATLDKPAFQRLLGPVEGIMRRTRYAGVKSGVEDVDPLHAAA